MDFRKSRRWLLPVLILAVLLIQPVELKSQCMVSTTNSNAGPTAVQVYKILSGSYFCSLTMQNAVFCSPTAMGNTTAFLLATALTATANPSCAWNCACGSITIDGSDGLPVELMDFEIADGADVLFNVDDDIRMSSSR